MDCPELRIARLVQASVYRYGEESASGHYRPGVGLKEEGEEGSEALRFCVGLVEDGVAAIWIERR